MNNDIGYTTHVSKNLLDLTRLTPQSNITHNMYELEHLYVTLAQAKNYIDIVVDDAFYNGIRIHTDSLTPGEEDNINNVINKEQDFSNSAITNIKKAIKYSRLYGDGILVIGNVVNAGVGMNKTILHTPLKVNKGLKLKYFVHSRWSILKKNIKGAELQSLETLEGEHPISNMYGKKIHHSRIFWFQGDRPPDLLKKRYLGWGISKLEHLVNPLLNLAKYENAILENIDEAKVSLFKMDTLLDNIKSSGNDAATKIYQMMNIVNSQKSNHNAVVIGSKDDFIQRQLTFNGMAEILTQARIQFVMATGMPMSKIVGEGSSGLNSDNQDMEMYYQRVESEVRQRYYKPISDILRIVLLQYKGVEYDDFHFSWSDLRIPTTQDLTSKKQVEMDFIFRLRDDGLIDDKTAIKMFNQSNITDLNINI